MTKTVIQSHLRESFCEQKVTRDPGQLRLTVGGGTGEWRGQGVLKWLQIGDIEIGFPNKRVWWVQGEQGEERGWV